MQKSRDPLFGTLTLFAVFVILYTGYSSWEIKSTELCTSCFSDRQTHTRESHFFSFVIQRRITQKALNESHFLKFLKRSSSHCKHRFTTALNSRAQTRPVLGVVFESTRKNEKLNLDPMARAFQSLMEQGAQLSAGEGSKLGAENSSKLGAENNSKLSADEDSKLYANTSSSHPKALSILNSIGLKFHQEGCDFLKPRKCDSYRKLFNKRVLHEFSRKCSGRLQGCSSFMSYVEQKIVQ